MNNSINNLKHKPLSKQFNVCLVDEIKFYDPNTNQEENCESWDEDCGRCGHFNFDISDNEIRFFYGESPIIGYCKGYEESLCILFHVQPTPVNFTSTGYFSFEKKYSFPKTMEEFYSYLVDFSISANENFMILAANFYDEFMSRNTDPEIDHSLPF
jgi:hypothetical protein